MFVVEKNHRVASGETASSVNCATYKEALGKYHEFAKNYLADTSVLAYSVSIIKAEAGTDMRIIKRERFPDDNADEQ